MAKKDAMELGDKRMIKLAIAGVYAEFEGLRGRAFAVGEGRTFEAEEADHAFQLMGEAQHLRRKLNKTAKAQSEVWHMDRLCAFIDLIEIVGKMTRGEAEQTICEIWKEHGAAPHGTKIESLATSLRRHRKKLEKAVRNGDTDRWLNHWTIMQGAEVVPGMGRIIDWNSPKVHNQLTCDSIKAYARRYCRAFLTGNIYLS